MGDGKDSGKVLDIKTADVKAIAPVFHTQGKNLSTALTTLVTTLDGLGAPWGDDEQGKAFGDAYRRRHGRRTPKATQGCQVSVEDKAKDLLLKLGLWWPDANSGSLRSVADAWRAFADSVDDVRTPVNNAATSLISNNTGEAIEAFSVFWGVEVGPAARPCKSTPCVGEPIDVATGAMLMTQTDLTLPAGLPLVFERTQEPQMGGVMKEEARAVHVAPWMHIITKGGGLDLDELLPASGDVHVARLNGHDMPDEESVFLKFWETLKFPEYFGWNWHAFYDCLRDLQWLSSDYHVLIIESAESVLSEDDVAREEFFGSLWRAGQRWSYTKRPEGLTLSKFSVVLSCGEEDAAGLASRLAEFQDQRHA